MPHNRTRWIIRLATLLGVCMVAWDEGSAAEGDAATLRSIQVELPNQEHNAVKLSWPEIGCWFWTGQEFSPEGYKEFLDEAYKHSAIRLLTTSIRYPAEVTDPKVHDQIRAAAKYARTHDLGIVMDLDARMARKAFGQSIPMTCSNSCGLARPCWRIRESLRSRLRRR